MPLAGLATAYARNTIEPGRPVPHPHTTLTSSTSQPASDQNISMAIPSPKPSQHHVPCPTSHADLFHGVTLGFSSTGNPHLSWRATIPKRALPAIATCHQLAPFSRNQKPRATAPRPPPFPPIQDNPWPTQDSYRRRIRPHRRFATTSPRIASRVSPQP